MEQDKNILILNCGSTSVKFQLINCLKEEALHSGHLANLGLGLKNHQGAIESIFKNWPSELRVDAVGHRVVHGGVNFSSAVVINQNNLKKIKECLPLAPLHIPHNLAGINEAMKLWKDVKHVATFDTAFHNQKPEEFYLYPLPKKLYKKYKIRKYGFHGASHKYVIERYAKSSKKDLKDLKLISCHLGGGSTVTAIKDGLALDTSSTFGTCCGLPMGTRVGDLDPTIILHLQENNYSLKEIYNILYKESGLLALSETSSDMKTLRAESKQGNKKAKLALKIYSLSLLKYIGSFLALLNGVDGLIFTGGIGENDQELRMDICSSLSWFGVEIDRDKNETIKKKEGLISSNNSKIKVMVIPTNEELMMAKEAFRALTPSF